MNFKILQSPFPTVDECIRDLEKKINEIDFKPEFNLIFVTESLYKNHKKLINFLKKKIGGKSISFFVEGFASSEGVWTRGVTILLTDLDPEISKTRDGNLYRELERVKEDIKNSDALMIVYPLVYFPGKFEILRGIIRDYRSWRRYNRCKTDECKEKVMDSVSNWLMRKRIFMPVNLILNELAKIQKPIAGINLLPIEALTNTPKIYLDYSEVNRNLVAIGLKNVKIHYHDIYPERGKSFEETIEIVKEAFAYRGEFDVRKKGIIIGEINNKRVKDLLKELFLVEIPSENEFVSSIEKKEFLMMSSYSLGFISKETHGLSLLGLLNTPLNFYPSTFYLDNFYESSILCGEIFKGGPKNLTKIWEEREDSNFLLNFIDSSILLSFRGEIHEIFSEMMNYKNWLSIFTFSPSAHLKISRRRYLSEMSKNIFYIGSGSTLLIEFK